MHFPRRQPLLVLLVLALASTVSCTSETVELCKGQYENVYSDAILALRPWMPATGRRLASLPLPALVPMAEADRRSWEEWSLLRLKETQHVMDELRADPRAGAVRDGLSSLADKLVVFHGYCGQGRVDRMVELLAKLREESADLRQQACKNH